MNRTGHENISIFCDGGCRANHLKENIGGYGVYIVYPGDLIVEHMGYAYETTNNRMELTGCIEALRLVQDKTSPVVVTTDSMYVINGITQWCTNWVRNDWRNAKGPIANKDLWLDLLAEKNKFSDIQFNWCKGHSDIEGNIRADKLANIAMDSHELHSL